MSDSTINLSRPSGSDDPAAYDASDGAAASAAARRDQAQRFRITFDQAAVGLSHTDPAGRWLLVNQRLCAMLGYTEAELLARTYQDITYPDDLAEDRAYFQRMLAGEIETFSMEKRYIRKDGSLLWVRLSVSMVRTADGAPEYFIGVIEDIDQRKRAELLSTRLGKILDESDNEIYVFDAASLRFIQTNRAARRNLGYSMDELARLTPIDLMSEFTARQFATLLKPLRTRKQSQLAFETVHQRKQGGVYPVEVRLHLADDEDPPVFVAIVQDMTARKQVEEMLRAGQTQLRNVIDSLFSFVGVLTPDGVMVEANRAALSAAELAPEDVVGKPFEETYWWSYAPEVRTHIRAAVRRAARGEIVRYDARARIADDRFLIIDFALTPMLDASGEIVYLIASGTDVTERVRTETALRQSEDRYRSLAIASAQIIWTTLPDGKVEDMPTWRRFTGQTQAEVRGWGWLDALHPDDRAATERAWSHAISTRGIYSTVYRVRRHDGVYRYFAVRGVPVLASDGAIREWVGACSDITERKQAEDALQFVAEASAAVASSLDYETTLETLARAAVPQVADYCTIHTLMDDGSIKQVAVAHTDPRNVALLWELERRYPIDPHDLRGLPLVIAANQPEIVSEALDARMMSFARDDEHARMLRSLRISSSMCLPLIARGRTRGAITFIMAESGRRYTERDLALVEELAGRAALALDNARLYEAEQQARRAAEHAAARTAQLQAVTAALSQALTQAQVVDVMLTQGIGVTGAYAGTVMLLSEDGSQLIVVGHSGYPAEWMQKWLQIPMTAALPSTDAVRTRQPIFLSAADWVERYPHLEPARLPTTGGAGSIPLVVGDRALGALTLSLSQGGVFDAAEQAFLRTLAGQCAQAIERTQLYEAEQRARRAAELAAVQTARLQTMTAALSEALTPEQVAAVVLDQTPAVLDAKGSLIAILSDDGATLEVIGSVGYPPEVIEQWRRFPLDRQAPLAQAVRSGEPVWLGSAADRVRSYPHLAENYARTEGDAWVSVPMKIENRVIGGISWSFSGARQLDDQMRRFMLTLAGQCAQAIIRAQLYEAERQARTAAELARQQLAFLAEASAVLAASLDYETTLANLARLAVPRLADMFVVDIIEQEIALRRVAVAHRNPAKEVLAQEIARRYPPRLYQNSLFAKALDERRALLLEQVPDSTVIYATQNDEHARLLQAVGPQRSLMLVPLIARGRTLGALVFSITESQRVYSQVDLTLAEDLAHRAALAIDNARLYHEAEQEIAQRKQAQAELRRSEEQLRLITEALPVLISYVDRDLRYRFNNKAYEDWFGRSRADLTGRYVRDVLGDEAYARLLLSMEQALAGQTITFQSQMLYRHGWRDVETTYIPDIGPQGEAVGFVVLGADVTERKRAEESQRFLAEASALLAASLDYETTLASVARLAVTRLADWCTVDIVDEDGSIRRLAIEHADPSKIALAHELLRRYPLDPTSEYGVAQVIRSGQSSIVPEISDAMLTNLISDPELLAIMRELGLTSSMTVPLTARGRTLGAITFIGAESGRRYDASDLPLAENLAQRAAIAVDNARLYRASQEAVSATRRYANQLHGLTDAALAINAALSLDDVLRIVTEQARTVIGAHQAVASFSADANWSQAINSFSLSDKYAAWRDDAAPLDGSSIYALAGRTNKPLRLTQAELEAHPAWRGFDGAASEHPPMRGWLAAPMTGRGGRNIGLLQLSDKEAGDFTESDEAILVQLAQMAAVAIENARLYQEAQEAILVRDDFLSIASHELKTPLTSLQLQAQSLLRLANKGNLLAMAPERLINKLELIDQQSSRLTRLANDLLDVARIRAGRIDVRLEELDVAALVRDVVERFEEQLALAGCSVDLGAADAVLVWSDRLRIEQVITNLLSNAIKYGAGKPIEISFEVGPDSASFTVRDQGIGIAPEHLERIFIRFERAVSARNYGGLGLGLYIARQIVESLGGAIRVTSEPGVGSAFTVTLPRLTAQR